MTLDSLKSDKGQALAVYFVTIDQVMHRLDAVDGIQAYCRRWNSANRRQGGIFLEQLTSDYQQVQCTIKHKTTAKQGSTPFWERTSLRSSISV